MANSVRWYGRVLRREDGHILGTALEFEVKGQSRKYGAKAIWKGQVEEECISVGLSEEDILFLLHSTSPP